MLPFCAALGVSASLWGMRGGREEASTRPPVFLCMVTNGDYAPGAVCLAQSLALVGSKARLRVIATSESAQQALLAEAQNCPTPCPMDVVLEQCALPEAAAGAQTHGAKGATLAVDAPRRCLFDDSREGFILLDADLIAIQSPDALFPLLSAPTTTTSNFHASANFRLKKKVRSIPSASPQHTCCHRSAARCCCDCSELNQRCTDGLYCSTDNALWR